MSDQILDNPLLASTAYWTAAVRAAESAREERLFDDPWAAALAGPLGRAWIEQRQPGSTLAIVLRTRYYDDFLLRECRENGIRQVVLMAAGLDTRACRLAWPAGVRLFELDQAPVLEHKQAVLDSAGAQPACQRLVVAADLTGPWEAQLEAAGYDPKQPSAWLLEGFLFYLPNADLARLLDRAVSLACAGSFIGFDIINSLILTSPLTKSWVEMQAQSGAPWIGSLDDPRIFLEQRGWQAHLEPVGGPQSNFGRWTLPVIPAEAPGLPHLWFVTGKKA
jgi:methyltransferase (TIGR00027 family)